MLKSGGLGQPSAKLGDPQVFCCMCVYLLLLKLFPATIILELVDKMNSSKFLFDFKIELFLRIVRSKILGLPSLNSRMQCNVGIY